MAHACVRADSRAWRWCMRSAGGRRVSTGRWAMAQTTTSIPTMNEVLTEAPKNWGRWGPDDEVGCLNYLTPDEVLRGVRHVKQGKVHTLMVMMGNPKGDPVWPGRRGAERLMVMDEGTWMG